MNGVVSEHEGPVVDARALAGATERVELQALQLQLEVRRAAAAGRDPTGAAAQVSEALALLARAEARLAELTLEVRDAARAAARTGGRA